MIRSNIDKYKYIDIDKSISKRLSYFRYTIIYGGCSKSIKYNWTDTRIDELWDKVYGYYR